MWEIIRSNKRKSLVLVVFMALLLLLIGAVFGEYFAGSFEMGLALAIIIWIVLSLIAFFQGRSIFLKISGAHRINKEDHPRLHNIVEEMKLAAMLPAMPEIYIIDDPAPNAFAVGQKPDSAAIAVTSGLLNTLNRDELQGVVAHEVAHIMNRDTLFMSMLGVMLGTIVMLAGLARRTLFWGGGNRRSRTSSSGGGQAQLIIMVVGLVLMIIAPILARLIYLAASRKREYLADASAAIYTRYPDGLAAALEKISVSPIRMRRTNQVTAPMYIINPIHKFKAGGDSLFSTHPSSLNRIKVLRSMAGGSGYVDYESAYRQVTGRNSVLPKSALTGKQGNQTRQKPGQTSDQQTSGKPKMDMAKAATGMVITGAILTDAISEPVTRVGKVRETTDAIWRSKGYRFKHCDCGAILKVPQDYRRQEVKCLRCHRLHSVTSLTD